MAYWVGSQYDRQQRIAQTSQNYDQVHATPVVLQGQDAFPPGQSTLESRRPAAYLARTFRYPVYDANSGNAFLPEQVVTGLPAGQATLDTRRPLAFTRPPYRLATYDANSGNTLLPELPGQDATVAGEQRDELPPKASARSIDLLTFLDASEYWLFGTDTVNPGEQSFDLPSLSALRARDYSWSHGPIPTLVGQDAMAAGKQSVVLPPSPAPLRVRDYSLTESFPLALNGQDAMVAGEQSTALPPIGPLRARDYTFAPPINLCCLTTVVQQIPYGQQVTDSLPARGPARARDYSWSQRLIPDLVGQDAVNAGKQSFDLVPSPAPLRARDYSITKAFPLTLISQDAMNAGEQSFGLPPIAALRARDYSFVPPVNLACLTTVVQQIPTGLQSTDSLPPRAAPRARDYSITAAFPLTLIGRDAMAAGEQSFALPPFAAPRAATLSEPGVNLALVLESQGQRPVGRGSEASALPPRAATRSRDYTWLQSAPLYVFQQLPAGQSSQETESPPRGPLRARDYTFLDLTKRHLIGQDAMVIGDSTYATDLPPRGYLRPLSNLAPAPINMVALFITPPIPSRDLAYTFSLAGSRWNVELADGRWTTELADDRWSFGPPQE